MPTLQELLARLDAGSDEIVLQSGQRPRRVFAGGEEPIADAALQGADIATLLLDSPFAAHLPSHDTAGEEAVVSLGGRSYRVRAARFMDLLEVRIARVAAPRSSEASGTIAVPDLAARDRPTTSTPRASDSAQALRADGIDPRRQRARLAVEERPLDAYATRSDPRVERDEPPLELLAVERTTIAIERGRHDAAPAIDRGRHDAAPSIDRGRHDAAPASERPRHDLAGTATQRRHPERETTPPERPRVRLGAPPAEETGGVEIGSLLDTHDPERDLLHEGAPIRRTPAPSPLAPRLGGPAPIGVEPRPAPPRGPTIDELSTDPIGALALPPHPTTRLEGAPILSIDLPQPPLPQPPRFADPVPLLGPDEPTIEIAIEDRRPLPAPRPAVPMRSTAATRVDPTDRAQRRPTRSHAIARLAAIGPGDASGPSLPPVIATVLAAARRRAASDVLLSSDERPRIRVVGRLRPDGEPIPAAVLSAAVSSLLPAEATDRLAERGHVDLALHDRECGRLRVNVSRHRTGVKIGVRLVAAAPSTPDVLGLPREVEAIRNHHQGLVVCAGPSGHGKTTTLASLVHLFNASKPVHIITVEDPVEILHPVARAIVTQREVETHTQSFASALAAALREDPDIIAIGELRDRETVEMALTAAETGHLVIATMSTPSGAKTIERLIDMFAPDDQNQVRATLAGALKLIVSQRLVPAADGRRRIAAFEVITGSIALWSMIRDRKLHQLPSLLQRGKAFGMVRLEDSLREMLLSGAITQEAALAAADDPRTLGGPDRPPGSGTFERAELGGG